VNQQFRLQRFQRAVPGPAGAHDDLELLARLIGAAGGTAAPADLAGVWRELAAAVPALAGRNFTTVPDLGLPLDPAPFAGLPFVEGPGLHYTPAKG
jgi:NADH-quinone oxidoreductase subunit G